MDKKMSLSKQEIIDYAARYVTPEEETDFPHNSDLFCLLGRKLSPEKILKDDQGWEFNGYGLCTGYVLDEEEQPVGKWLWMHFLSLIVFPPIEQVLKLQPPHVVKGQFQNSDRSYEFKFVKITIKGGKVALHSGTKAVKKKSAVKSKTPAESTEKKIIPFRAKK